MCGAVEQRSAEASGAGALCTARAGSTGGAGSKPRSRRGAGSPGRKAIWPCTQLAQGTAGRGAAPRGEKGARCAQSNARKHGGGWAPRPCIHSGAASVAAGARTHSPLHSLVLLAAGAAVAALSVAAAVATRQRCRRSANGAEGSGRHAGCNTPHGVQRTQRHGCQHASACAMLARTVAIFCVL